MLCPDLVGRGLQAEAKPTPWLFCAVLQDVCTNKLRQFECKVCAGKSIPSSSPRALLLGPYACMVAFSSFATPHVPWGNRVCSPRVAPQAVRFTLLKDLIGFVQYEAKPESQKGGMQQRQH